MFAIAGFTIIFDEQGRVLLCHRTDMDAWDLPGGSAKGQELPNETALRETREETGLEVALERLVGVYGNFDEDEIVFSFIARVVSGELGAETDEIDDWRYFAPESLPRNTAPKHVERLWDALQHEDGQEPLFRRHTAPSTEEMVRRLEAEEA